MRTIQYPVTSIVRAIELEKRQEFAFFYNLYASKAVEHQRLMEFLDTIQDQSSMPRVFHILHLKDAIVQAKRKRPRLSPTL